MLIHTTHIQTITNLIGTNNVLYHINDYLQIQSLLPEFHLFHPQWIPL